VKLPQIVVPPPGPRSRALSARLAELEAPGVNTLFGGSGGQPSILWEEAHGATVRDVDGNLYLDLTAGFGVAAVGHAHPEVVRAVREQAEVLVHGLGDVHAHPKRVELAERLVRLAPVGELEPPQVFFSISGAESVEIALKTAVAATGRSAILAFEPSYHGLTLGALAVTSRPEFRAPFRALLHAQVRRLPFACDPERIEELLRSAEVAAVIVEPVVGRDGVLVPPPGWLAALAGHCRAAGTVLIADEVFTGFGRTGTLFAVEAEGVRPDLLCCGKALGGGLPIAAVVGRRDLFRVWETPGEALHTATFLANPLACAAALAVLEILEREALPARAARLGEVVGAHLAAWRDRFPEKIAAVRGRGLLWGVELATAAQAKRWCRDALQRGILLLAGGPEGKVAQLVPPLTISEEQLGTALGLLEEGLSYSPR
jgi:4-aminobutyrate aminotransferase-like enzyme